MNEQNLSINRLLLFKAAATRAMLQKSIYIKEKEGEGGKKRTQKLWMGRRCGEQKKPSAVWAPPPGDTARRGGNTRADKTREKGVEKRKNVPVRKQQMMVISVALQPQR